MSERKILIICPSMWPEMSFWGETQRMYYLANHLAQKGWQVFTVSPGYIRKHGDEKREKYYTDVFLGHKQPAQGSPAKEPGRDSCFQKIRSRLFRLSEPVLRWIYNEPNCYEGISKQLWRIKYQNDVYRLIEKEGIQNVLVSIPAFTLMKFGVQIKKRFPDVCMTYDYRDPWYLWNKKKNFAYCRERKYLRSADKIVGFSEKFSADLISEMKVGQEKAATVYNGYSEKDWSAFENSENAFSETKTGKLRLAYVGNINLSDDKDNFRNPARLIEAVRKFSEVELYFVGVNDAKAGTVEENVHFVGCVSQMEAFRYMKESEVLISIHDTKDYSGSYVISGKFFDYMRSGKVIFHIGATQDLMSRMVRDFHLGICCRNSEDELEKAIGKLLVAWKNDEMKTLRNCKPSEIRRFSREYQNDRYDAILRES